MDRERTEPVDDRRAPHPRTGASRVGLVLFFIVTTGLAGAAVLSGAVQRIVDGWQPQGDDAAIAWLAHDVFSRHSPLVGMPSTIGGTSVDVAHHWGPLLFWVLSAPQKLASGDPAGLQVALVLLSLAAIVGVAVFTYRRLGHLGTLTILCLLGLMSWSLGRQILSSIWNPDIAVLPLVCVFVLVWSVADGDHLALPFLAFGASFVVQCNLLYTPLVAVLLVWALVGFVVTQRERNRAGSALGRRRLGRILLITGVVILVCWSAPIIQEITHRPGNVEQVLENGSSEGGPAVGVTRALWMVVHAIGIPPVWTHPATGFGRFSLYEPASLLATATAIGFALIVIVGLIVAWRHRPAMRSLLGTATFGLLGVAIVASQIPLGFGVPPYRLRSLWVTGMFVGFAVIVLAARSVARAVERAPNPVLLRARVTAATTAVLSVVLVVVAVLGATGDTAFERQNPDSSEAVRRLVDSARSKIPKPGPYLATHTTIGVGTGVFWGLARRGFDIRMTPKSDPFDAPYLADAHGPRGARLRRLYLVDQSPPAPPVPGASLLATATTPVSRQQDVRKRRAAACRQLEAHPPPITARGHQMLEQSPPTTEPDVGDVAALAAYANGERPCSLIGSTLDRLSQRHAVALSDPQVVALALLGIAENISAGHTYALYLGPR